MKDFHSRKKQKSFYQSRLYFVILFVAIVISVRATASAFHKKEVAHTQEQKILDRYNAALEKKEKYLKDLDRLQSDRGREEELRTRFDVVRDGETMIKIID